MLTSHGDLNMQTQDMVNVDRVFFNSNDGRDATSTKSYITSYLSNTDSASLLYQVPAGYTHHFYIGYGSSAEILNLSSLGVLTNHDLTVFGDIAGSKEVKAGAQIKVGSLNKGAANGMLWLDGNDVKVQSGGATKSLSDIGTGGGGGTPHRPRRSPPAHPRTPSGSR